jgi:hypothetical protein
MSSRRNRARTPRTGGTGGDRTAARRDAPISGGEDPVSRRDDAFPRGDDLVSGGDDAVIARALRWSLAVFAVVAVCGGLAAVWFLRPPPRPAAVETKLALPAGRPMPRATIPAIPFTDVTAAAGIDFVHENGAAGEKLLPETMGGGCGFFDMDGDGDQDLILTSGCRWPWDERPAAAPATMALYRNDGTGRFENVTAGSGLDVSFYGTGLAIGDYDADGLPDLFVAAVGPDRLFRNLGGGRFVDTTAAAGVAGGDGEWGTSCGFFDADGDGDLDLFVCNYVEWSPDLDRSQDFRLVGGGRAYGRPQNFAGAFPRLHRNDGAGRFTDVSAEAGVRVTNPATGVPVGKSLGVAFDDLDGDGATDVVVANDTVQNFLFHNRGGGRFAEIGREAGIAYDGEGRARGAMGIDIGRFRNDDEIGIVIGNFANEMSALYVSRGRRLQFKDDAVSNGFGPETRQELTFGVLFADLDLDGRLDIVSANGHLEEDINKVQKTQFYEQSPELFWNCGPAQPLEFVPVSAASVGRDFHRPLVGRAAATADIDGDGDLELLLTASGGRPRLLRNDQRLGHHWLRVALVGRPGNTGAIGALVSLHRDGSVQSWRVGPTRSYQSQCELPATLGLGSSTDTGAVTIRWPDGTTTEHAGLEPDRLHTIRQP